MSSVIFLIALVEYIVWTDFVDRVVGQMHHHILLIITRWFLIGTGGKSAQSLSVDVYFQRRDTLQEHIYPQIEFHLIN